MTFESVVAELLALPLNEFTPTRNLRAKELKAAGDRDLAARVMALRKPSVQLWAVNRLAEERHLLAKLRDTAGALVEAQTSGGRRPDAAALRQASEEFQRSLEGAADAAAARLREHGHAAGEEVLRRIREILRISVLHGDETWHLLQQGALTTEPTPSEDAAEMFRAVAVAPGAGNTRQRRDRHGGSPLVERAARADAERAQRAAEVARRLRQEANELAIAAERAAERAKAAEEEAARAQKQAEHSQRAPRSKSRAP
jgi:hypothetical protein